MDLSNKRKNKGLTQKETAELVGLSRGAYTNIECGKRKPSVSAAKKIGELLGFDWTRFYDEETETIPQSPCGDSSLCTREPMGEDETCGGEG